MARQPKDEQPRIRHNIADGILWLKLNDPQTANSFSPAAAAELAKILNTKAAREAQGLVMSAAEGRTFCSGGDLGTYANLPNARAGIAINRRMTEVIQQLEQLPIFKICLITGDCWGGGMEFIAAFNYRISVPQAMFGFWQRRIALSFGWGGAQRWLQRVSAATLESLAISARAFGAYEAQRLGFVDEIVSSVHLESRAQDIIKAQGSLSKRPVAGIRAAVHKPNREAQEFAKLWLNPDHESVLQVRRKTHNKKSRKN